MKFVEYQDLLPSEILETVKNIHAELLAMGFTEEIKERITEACDSSVIIHVLYCSRKQEKRTAHAGY